MVTIYQLVGVVLCIGLSTCSPPSFNNFPNIVQVHENIPYGSRLFSFTLSDSNKSHTVHLTASPSDLVKVTPSSGLSRFTVNVTLIGYLDREIASTHSLRFTATDDSSNEVTKSLTLYVSDVNDNAPTFLNVPYFWDIPELPCNDTTLSSYTRIRATDPDVGENGTVSYSIMPVTQSDDTSMDYLNTFSIDNKTGDVDLKKCLSYLNNSYYQFLVIAKDEGVPKRLSSNVSLVIRVRDVQNQPPFFTGVPYRRSIDENTLKNTTVLELRARDGDTGVPNKVTYTIAGGSCNDSFTIDSTSGQISTLIHLDRDSGSINDADGVCVLNILATEIESNSSKQYGNTTSTTDVTITVNDLNDNSPYFVNVTTYNASIPENAQQNVPLNMVDGQEIQIIDEDQMGDDFSTMDISLSWPNGSVCNSFKVSPNIVRKSGSIIIQVEDSSILDFEVVQQIQFMIIATERANTSHTASANVTLSLSDENDNTPQFSEQKYEFEINEGVPNGTSVGKITSTDADSGDFKNVTYSLLGSEEKFKISPLTGEITTVCDPKQLDREKISTYYLTVTATDDGGQGRSNSTSVRIELQDVNDNAPVFLRDVYQTFVKENEEFSNRSVLTVSAQDIDEYNTSNSHVEFFLNETKSSWIASNISINTTGELYFIHPIDYEKLPDTNSGRFNFTVYARDRGQPQLTGNATVEITVEDVNDNTPTFIETLYEAEVPENATSTLNALFSVLNVSATDMDGSERNHRFQYFIINGANNRFTVDPDTGNVYVQRNAMLDRETESTYNITMVAIDLGTTARTGTTEVIITVTDVNDEHPEFNSTTCVTPGVSEGAPTDTSITTCGASDADENPDLYYNITNIHATDEDGNDVDITDVQNYFRITPKNGTVFVNGTLDRETAETVVLTIEVKDQNGELNTPQVASKTLTITLLDVNDNDPVFLSNNYTMSVSENALNPTRLDTIQATDEDVNRTITYSIDSGETPTESFRIDNKTGIIYKNGSVDREKNSTVLLHVTATDNGIPTRNSTTTVLIDVIDYNDNSPIFFPNSTNPSLNITEDLTNGTVVTSIAAYDIDDGPNAIVVYEIESGADGHFGIDHENGTIYTISLLDRETTQSYMIRILAKDSPTDESETRVTRTVLTITLDDVNDNAPNFTQTLYNVNIQETASVGETVATIIATDKDVGVNSKLRYSFGNNTNPPGLFAVHNDSGRVHVNNSLRSRVGSYLVQLMAEDGGEPSLNGSTVVNITVEDVNINPPIIDGLPDNDTIRVYECFKIGTDVYRFNYSDEDHGQNAKAYFNITSIDPDNVLSKFRITEDGALMVKGELNANNASSYRFQIQATDRGLPTALSSEKHTIIIHVIDVNNYIPGFDNNSVDFSVRENEPNETAVGTVTAVDDDKDSVSCYSITDTLDSRFFDIGKTSGTIRTKRSIDREVDGDSLSIIVKVYDCTVSDGDKNCGNDTIQRPGKDRSPNITVTIHITDVDDNPPVFTSNEISVGMRRNEEVGFILDIDLKNGSYVKDNDTDQYGKQAWKFSNNGTATVSTELGGKVSPGSGTNQCPSGGRNNLFCITGNGTIVNNKFFSEDMSGFVLLPVSVEDKAGSDQSLLKIYLISDSQVLIMTIFDPKQKVAKYKDELLEIYSDITKYTFVYDGLQDHKTPTSIDTSRSDLYFHIVDPLTQRILPSDEAQRLIDGFYELLRDAASQYKVLQVLASTASQQVEEDDPMRTVYILSAVVVLLVLTVAIIVYVSLTLRSRYQRKIKALTVDKIPIVKKESNAVIPGSNQYSKTSNPLLNANINTSPLYDTISVCSNDSIDKNEVGAPRDETFYDELEVKEKSMELYMELNMEDVNPEWSESPLDAALRMHDMKKASLDEIDDGSAHGDRYDDSDDNQSQDKVAMHGFRNETFEMETSEI